ncbi:MAG: DEAD/DEAH box helicase [Thermoplasmata archaeon]|nr:MAG: DEAD/DEAH box helicase [Thermoplasmata archaeon]
MTPSEKASYSEDALVEQPAIELFEQLGWTHANCFNEFDHVGGSFLGRENKGEVILVSKLKPVLRNLNPELPEEALDLAIEELKRDRSMMSMVQANREVYNLIRDGVKVKFKNPEDGSEIEERIKIIDWNNPDNNDYFLASQFWITGEMYTRRTDLLGFINGIPLVFVELKASHRNIKAAYDDNLSDYKVAIPHLFWYNGFVILSNGSDSKIGSITSEWEHFSDWKKINREGEEGIISLETMIRGTCDSDKLLDLLENFILFSEVRGGTIKIIAKNHQYLGVNNAIDSIKQIRHNQGKLGVFWHTQGSGKSISMVFFSQKIFRKIQGNWTFVILTDRIELDDQIYKTYASTGAVTRTDSQAKSSEYLRDLLTEDHRYIFTLIHKFRTPEIISTRSDIIVIADEAHRTQYDTLAMNMRIALPNAAYIAFTGTPLIAGEERTKEVFGDYISIYNFKQSVEDEATVRLYYENRIPSVRLDNEDLNEQIYQVIENAELDEDQEVKLEREFSHQYHIITREDRLEAISKDIVEHFMGRGFKGKSMVVSIDKATAVKMYNKVKVHWERYLQALEHDLKTAPVDEQERLNEIIEYMKTTDMAVVVSQSANEVRDLREKGLDITPHRKRIIDEDLDTKFKNPDDPLRIVFVCAMWMTGFDVPSCSTIYLDKPMRNHTLMQTIARANRVFPGKSNGLIVDYIGVFRNLEQALSIYGPASGGGIREGDRPILDKGALVEELRNIIIEADKYCTELGINTEEILKSSGFQRIALLDQAVDAILIKDETKNNFLTLAGKVKKIYKAILPDPRAVEFAPITILFDVIAKKIQSLAPPPDITGVMGQIEDILNSSIMAEGYIIDPSDHLIDLTQIDFDALAKKFVKGNQHTETERLKSILQYKLRNMIRLNRSRMDYLEKYKDLIDDYNAGSINIEELFNQLLTLAQSLKEEEKRAIAENLSEEELAIFDILTKPDLQLTDNEILEVKKIVRMLLQILNEELLVLDWKKQQRTQARVKVAIEDMLDNLPEKYDAEIYQQKANLIFEHIYDSYYGDGNSVYANV